MKSNFQELKSHYIDYKHIYTGGSKDDIKGGCASLGTMVMIQSFQLNQCFSHIKQRSYKFDH